MKEEFVKLMCDKLCIVKEDLTDNEWVIINMSFAIVLEKIEDLKLANESIKRLTIENANLKAYNDDTEYYHDDSDTDDMDDEL